MPAQPPSTHARRNTWVMVFLAACSVAMIALQINAVRDGRPSVLETWVAAIVSPVQQVVSGAARSIGGGVGALGSWARLPGENARLAAENARLELENRLLRDAKAENVRLRVLLRLQSRMGVRAVAAEVIAWDPNGWVKVVTVDKGSADGVTPATVVLGLRGLAGRVSKISPHSATVRLILDERSAVPAQIAESRAVGIVYGSEGRRLTMRYIDASETVNPGDTVVTSGMGRVFAKGIVIGTVTTVLGRNDALFKTVQVEPAVDFGALEHVLLLPGPQAAP